MSGETLLYALVTTAAGVFMMMLFVVGVRPVSSRELSGFASRYGLTLTPTTTAVLSPELRVIRGLRLVGAALGFATVVLLRAATQDQWATGPTLLWAATGYLFGALVASVRSLPVADDKIRVAVLSPRRALDYLPRLALVWPPLTSAVAVAAGITEHIVRRRPDATSADRVVAPIVLCLVATAVTLAAIRAVVRRSQVAPDAELVTADDALRAHGLHVVAGIGIAIAGATSAATLFQLGIDSASQPLRWICPWLGVGELGLATTAWFGLRTASWRVRRRLTT